MVPRAEQTRGVRQIDYRGADAGLLEVDHSGDVVAACQHVGSPEVGVNGLVGQLREFVRPLLESIP